MKILITLAVLILGLGSLTVVAQFPQATKNREKAEIVRRQEEDAKNGKSTAPFRGKMNVDVQMVLARQDVKSFAEAKPLAVAKVTDGEPLWMYIKFNGNLGKYVYRKKDEEGNERYLLAVEYGSQGEMFAKDHYLLSFAEPDLSLTELKIAMTTGIPGRNRSIGIFIKNAATAKPVSSVNELRLANSFGIPRGPDENLAKIPLTTDFTKGLTKYSKMLDDYNSNILRGTTDLSKLPIEGKFDDAGIRARLWSELRESGTEPTKMYFTADDWVEYSELPMSVMQTRSMSAAFTYNRDGSCYYGVAEITQPFDAMTNRYGASVFKIVRDMPTACVAGN